jgi:hypothetical protein
VTAEVVNGASGDFVTNAEGLARRDTATSCSQRREEGFADAARMQQVRIAHRRSLVPICIANRESRYGSGKTTSDLKRSENLLRFLMPCFRGRPLGREIGSCNRDDQEQKCRRDKTRKSVPQREILFHAGGRPVWPRLQFSTCKVREKGNLLTSCRFLSLKE